MESDREVAEDKRTMEELKKFANTVFQCLHDREKVQLQMKAVRSLKSCLTRQVNEPVRILSSKADMLLNFKNEFHQAPLTRLVAVTGLQGSQEENESSACLRAGRAATVGNPGSGSAAGRRRAPRTR